MPTRSRPLSRAVPRARGAVAWVQRWGISVASLIGGVLTLFVFRRGLPHVGWIVGSLLLLWLVLAAMIQVRDALAASGRRTHRLVLTAGDYTIQTLYHGIVLFLLPAYYAAATLTSVNVVFLLLLLLLALLATFDPWYRAIVHPRPWITSAFFLVSVFGALNVALPLVGVPPFAALMLSAWTAVVALTPAVCRARRWSWRRGLTATALTGVAAMWLAGVGRVAIPPAPLFLARATLGWSVAAVESLEPLPGAIPAGELRRRGLVAYTAIYAPAGLRQPIEHVWRLNGRVITVVPLSPVLGGRSEGFRTWSRKTVFPPDPVGRWSVDVVTRAGQLIGRVGFRVAE